MSRVTPWRHDHPFLVSVVAISVATGVVALAAWGAASESADDREGLVGGLLVLLVAYVVCVPVLASAHARIRRSGIGNAPEHPHPAGLVGIGVASGAIGYDEGGSLPGAVPAAVAGMAAWWVLYVVVRSRVGSRRLATGPWSQHQTGSPAGSGDADPSPTKVAPRTAPSPEPAVARIVAAVGAGLVALAVAVAKSLESWVAVLLAFLAAFAVPLAVTWVGRLARPPESVEAGRDTVAPHEDGSPATTEVPDDGRARHPAEPAPAGASAPGRLTVRPRGPRWFGGLLVGLSLLMGVIAVWESGSAVGDAGPLAFGGVGVLLAGMALLQFRVGVSADDSGVTITNTFREVTIPWSDLESIEFQALPGNALGLDLYKLVFATRDSRSFVAEAPTGGKDPGTYLFDIRYALIGMRNHALQGR